MTPTRPISATTAKILPFPPRGPFAVRVEREHPAYLVVYRSHGWLFGNARDALAEANAIARDLHTHTQIRIEQLPHCSSAL
jgi:hypothetical protein